MSKIKKVNDFVKKDFGWDALELIFMLQSHSYDFGCCMTNNEFDRKVKDSRIEYCFDICNKMLNDECTRKRLGDCARYSVNTFYRIPSQVDLPDGCLYSRQIPSDNFKSYHHFCCGPAATVINDAFNKTKLYKIYLKKNAKVLFLQQAIDTIIRKPYKSKLFNNGEIREPYEIIVLGKDVERVEKFK